VKFGVFDHLDWGPRQPHRPVRRSIADDRGPGSAWIPRLFRRRTPLHAERPCPLAQRLSLGSCTTHAKAAVRAATAVGSTAAEFVEGIRNDNELYQRVTKAAGLEKQNLRAAQSVDSKRRSPRMHLRSAARFQPIFMKTIGRRPNSFSARRRRRHCPSYAQSKDTLQELAIREAIMKSRRGKFLTLGDLGIGIRFEKVWDAFCG
jgi:hypothetical protein